MIAKQKIALDVELTSLVPPKEVAWFSASGGSTIRLLDAALQLCAVGIASRALLPLIGQLWQQPPLLQDWFGIQGLVFNIWQIVHFYQTKLTGPTIAIELLWAG